MLPTDVPGKPETPLPSNVKDTSVSLSWRAPKSDGGTPITHYIVEMKSSMVSRWTPVTTDDIKDTEYIITKLTKGETYEFRVIAVNKAGQGKPSDSCKPTKAETPISKCFGYSRLIRSSALKNFIITRYLRRDFFC